MQTQYQHVVHHHDPFVLSHSAYPLPDPLVASSEEVDFTHSFLGGSSSSTYSVHEDSSRFHFYRGEVTYSLPTSSSAVGGLDATGIGFAANPPVTASSLFPAGEYSSFMDPAWSWNQAQASVHGVVAPVPMLPTPTDTSFLSMKGKEEPSIPLSLVRSRSPGPPLPTPAAMTVFSHSRPRPVHQTNAYDSPTLTTRVDGHAAVPPAVTAAPGRADMTVSESTSSREKKHACTMCHKRFDRPSTLRKHLLVHTGEKAFVCDICGRRFGVASNLNRHTKRCALKPVNMSSNKSSSDSASGSEEATPQTSPVAPAHEPQIQRRQPAASQKRASISSSSSSEPPRGRDMTSSIRTSSETTCSAKPAKRRRRAPSPSRWVPLSLLSFNLQSEEQARSVQVPLPPVRRHLPREERDSWDENRAPRPYHPDEWQGTLPGPGFAPNQGLKGKEVAKFNFGSGGATASAFTVGRVVVY